MTDQIIPPSSGADGLLTALTRIADALERLASSGAAANCIREDSSRYLCETISEGLYQLRDKPKAPTKGRGRQW